MRTSQFPFATLREPPADAVSIHERLLRRAGFVRKVEAGTYVFLPLGARLLRKMKGLLERECEAACFHPFIAHRSAGRPGAGSARIRSFSGAFVACSAAEVVCAGAVSP